MRSMRGPLAVLSLTAACLLLGGCGDPAEVASLQGQVSGLKRRVDESEKQRDALFAKVAELDRRVRGQSEDLANLYRRAPELRPARPGGSLAPAASLGDGPGGGPGGDAELDPSADEAPADAEAVRDFLATEEGMGLIEKTYDQIQRRRDTERMDAAAARMVERFAEEADLSADQVERMKVVTSRTMGQMRDLMTGMRDSAADLDEAGRQALREESVAKMTEIRTQADEEVKQILSSSQYELYQERTSRMRGGDGPGFGGLGGRPGGGGRGGRGDR